MKKKEEEGFICAVCNKSSLIHDGIYECMPSPVSQDKECEKIKHSPNDPNCWCENAFGKCPIVDDKCSCGGKRVEGKCTREIIDLDNLPVSQDESWSEKFYQECCMNGIFANDGVDYYDIEEEIKSFIQSQILQAEERGFQTGSINKAPNFSMPIGVSQWLEYGKKYGYADYFESQAEERTKKECLEKLKQPRAF